MRQHVNETTWRTCECSCVGEDVNRSCVGAHVNETTCPFTHAVSFTRSPTHDL